MFRFRIVPKSWCRTLHRLQSRSQLVVSHEDRTCSHLSALPAKYARGLGQNHTWLWKEERQFCSKATELSEADYEVLADETLDLLTEMFEDIQEKHDVDPEYDVSFNSGVLTVKVSSSWGTYVINKQTPNKQIWFSSPKSGPKRYDYVDGRWIYKHDGSVMHELLSNEISEALGQTCDFTALSVCSS